MKTKPEPQPKGTALAAWLKVAAERLAAIERSSQLTGADFEIVVT